MKKRILFCAMKKALIYISVVSFFLLIYAVDVKAIGIDYFEGTAEIHLEQSNVFPSSHDYSNLPYFSDLNILDECIDNNGSGIDNINNNYSDDTFLCLFNCHYFTFFTTVPERHNNILISNNYYWLSDISPFLNNLYIETSRQDAEIIVYYNSINQIAHSGRILSINNGTPNGIYDDTNLIQVISKWEDGNVIIHRGDYCPYAPSNGGYVKYYKYYNSSYNISYSSNIQQHIKTYNFYYASWYNGIILDHRAIVNVNGYNSSIHYMICEYGGCNYSSTESHTIHYVTYDEEKHIEACSLCNYASYEYHNWYQVSGILYRCTECGQTARFIPIIHDGFNNPLFVNKKIICINNNYYYIDIIE